MEASDCQFSVPDGYRQQSDRLLDQVPSQEKTTKRVVSVAHDLAQDLVKDGKSGLHGSVPAVAFGPPNPTDDLKAYENKLKMLKEVRKDFKREYRKQKKRMTSKEQAVAYLQLRRMNEDIEDIKETVKVLDKMVHVKRDAVLHLIERVAEPALKFYEVYIEGSDFYDNVGEAVDLGGVLVKGLFVKKKRFLRKLMKKERQIRDGGAPPVEFNPLMWIGALMDFKGFYDGAKGFWTQRKHLKTLNDFVDHAAAAVVTLDEQISSGTVEGDELIRLKAERDFLWEKIGEVGEQAQLIDKADADRECALTGAQAAYAGMELSKGIVAILALASTVPGIGLAAVALDVTMLPIAGMLQLLGWNNTSGNLRDAQQDLAWVRDIHDHELKNLSEDVHHAAVLAADDPNHKKMHAAMVGAHEQWRGPMNTYLQDHLKDKVIEEYLIRLSEVFALLGTMSAAAGVVALAPGGLPGLPFLAAGVVFGILSVATRVGATTLVRTVRRLQRKERHISTEDYLDGLIEQMKREQECWEDLVAQEMHYHTVTFTMYGLLQNHYPATPKNWGPSGWARSLLDDPDGEERERLETALERMVKHDDLRMLKSRFQLVPRIKKAA